MIKLTVILLILTIGIFGFLLTGKKSQGQQSYPQDSNDEPTIVELGRPKSSKEKAYSKEFSNYLKIDLSDRIKLAKEQNLKGEILKTIQPTLNQGFLQFPAPKFLQFLTCISDAIVFGSPTSKTACLTEEENWVYTEYNFSIKEILKQNPNSPLEINENIQIIRSGGLIKLDGYVFRFENTAIQQLERNKHYLLFLKYVPEANGYTANNSLSDFILEGNRFISLSKASLPEKIRMENDYQTIFNDVRSSVKRSCDFDSNGEINKDFQ